jgi:hypothetical protein
MDKLLSWGRYLFWAELMRRRWDEYMVVNGENPEIPEWLAINAYWPASLFVVIEGWQDQKLSDPVIDALLQKATYVETLRRLRNGTFHYQPSLLSPKMIEFHKCDDAYLWITALHDEFLRYFRERFTSIPATPEMQNDLQRVIADVAGWFPPAEPIFGLEGQISLDSLQEELDKIKRILAEENPSPEWKLQFDEMIAMGESTIAESVRNRRTQRLERLEKLGIHVEGT